jgi:hypothetical protein
MSISRDNRKVVGPSSGKLQRRCARTRRRKDSPCTRPAAFAASRNCIVRLASAINNIIIVVGNCQSDDFLSASHSVTLFLLPPEDGRTTVLGFDIVCQTHMASMEHPAEVHGESNHILRPTMIHPWPACSQPRFCDVLKSVLTITQVYCVRRGREVYRNRSPHV